jgi:DNA-binding CsgD family transcriptional regulator
MTTENGVGIVIAGLWSRVPRWEGFVVRGEDELIGTLYDAALGQRSWDEAGNRLVKHMGGVTLMMSLYHPQRRTVELVTTRGLTADHLRQYSEYYAHHDLWAIGGMKPQFMNRAAAGWQLIPDRELERSMIYNDYLLPQINIHHVAGSLMTMDDGNWIAFGIHRSPDMPDYDLGEVERLSRLLPHVKRSLEIRRRLRMGTEVNQSVTDALDRLTMGVVVLGTTGKLLHVNTAADAILRKGDGLVRSAEGLRALRKDDERRLQELIAGVRRLRPSTGYSGSAPPPAGGHTRIRRMSDADSYAVMVTPAGAHVGESERDPRATLVFITDPATPITSTLTALRELFGFTPAEARLVQALITDVPLPEFARQAGVSYNTVRTVLARAMARTETHSQVELVLLVARSLAGATLSGD